MTTYSLGNGLKMIPFDKPTVAKKDEVVKELYEYDLSTYYFLRIHLDVIANIKTMFQRMFKE